MSTEKIDKTKRKKSQKRKKGLPVWATIIICSISALILFLAGAGVYLLKFYNPELESAPSSHNMTWLTKNYTKSYYWTTVLAPGHKGNKAENTVLLNPSDEGDIPAALVPSARPVRNEQSVNFLLMGHDRVALNTDVIMLVNFDMDEGSLDILQIPRDTFYKTGRVNTLMANKRGMARNADPSLSQKELLKKGMAGAVSDLEKSLGVVIDGYAIIDLEGFRKIIDDLGGVYMDVPYAMHYDDPEQNLSIHLDPGPQTLNGEQAEMFVRYRAGYAQGDIGRVNAQKIFLTALLSKIKDINASQAVNLAKNAINYVTTDLDIDEIIFYAKEFLGTDMGKVSMVTLPGYHTTSSSGASYYVMNRAATMPLINDFFNVFDNYEVDESKFDTERDFTSTDKRFTAIYDSQDYQAVIENAESISQGQMNAPPQ